MKFWVLAAFCVIEWFLRFEGMLGTNDPVTQHHVPEN